jgi:hypothetical protein
VAQKSKNQNIQTHNLATVLYGSETWPLTLRDEHRLRAFENRVLRRISVLKSDEIIGGCENCILRSFITYILHQI